LSLAEKNIVLNSIPNSPPIMYRESTDAGGVQNVALTIGPDPSLNNQVMTYSATSSPDGSFGIKVEDSSRGIFATSMDPSGTITVNANGVTGTIQANELLGSSGNQVSSNDPATWTYQQRLANWNENNIVGDGVSDPTFDGPQRTALSGSNSVAPSNDLLSKLQAANVSNISKEDVANYLKRTVDEFQKSQGLTVTEIDQQPTGIQLNPGDQVAWSSKSVPLAGWDNVHGRAVYEKLDGVLPRAQLDLINMADVAVDYKDYQTGSMSWLHGMQGDSKDGTEYYPQEKSQALTDAWIKFNYQKSQEILQNGGDPALALLHYGFAVHSLQDTTSPEHNSVNAAGQHEFKDWHDEEKLSVEIPHVLGEATYPGNNSNLGKATQNLFDIFFRNQAMPNDLIFNHWGVDPIQRPNPIKVMFG
jgi:hypothetical protein